MKTITPNQLRSAKSFLGWSHKHLADQLGVSLPTIGKWQIDGCKIPEAKSILIREVFYKHDIEFIEDRGCLQRFLKVENYTGDSGFRALFDTIYNNLQANPHIEICAMGINESLFFEKLDFAKLYSDRMQTLRPKMRVILGSTELKNLQSYAEYRISSIVNFDSTPFYIYDNRVTLISWKTLEAITIDSSECYQSFKALFENIWDMSKASNK